MGVRGRELEPFTGVPSLLPETLLCLLDVGVFPVVLTVVLRGIRLRLVESSENNQRVNKSVLVRRSVNCLQTELRHRFRHSVGENVLLERFDTNSRFRANNNQRLLCFSLNFGSDGSAPGDKQPDTRTSYNIVHVRLPIIRNACCYFVIFEYFDEYGNR